MKKRLKDLPNVLSKCSTEEEVKSEFANAFGLRLDTRSRRDLYTPQVLFEFKYDKNLSSIDQKAKVIAQTLYYTRELKYGTESLPVSPFIAVVDKNGGFIFKTKLFSSIYTSKKKSFDWDRAASTPCPKVVSAIKKLDGFSSIHVYDFSNSTDYENFISVITNALSKQLSLDFDEFDKKEINENNFVDAFVLWNKEFGEYVKNGRKPAEYFGSDIQFKKSFLLKETNTVVFNLNSGDSVSKPMPVKEYEYFWNTYAKCKDTNVIQRIWQRLDRLTKEDYRRFTGEFYTPVAFGAKAVDYITRTVGDKWWENGYRLWDMAAGTGNLEYELPEEALQFCYISTLLEDDAKYCEQLYPSATVFQYDYLNDDVIAKFENNIDLLKNDVSTKLPKKLLEDLSDQQIKWIILINPPFVTANEARTKKSERKAAKENVSATKVRELMTSENLGEASRELFSQFLWRISYEFKNRKAYLGLFSTLKYINSNNDQRLRDSFFKFRYKCGFVFPAKVFQGNKGDFPIGFLVWNLHDVVSLDKQTITADIYNDRLEKIGIKKIPSTSRIDFLSKWVMRERNTVTMPPFSSALTIGSENKDVRDRVAKDFIGSLACPGNDFQHQNTTYLLSGPGVSAGAFSITPTNFEKAMIIYTVRKLPLANWLNDRDQFMQPNGEEFDEYFITDCLIWNLFSVSNNTVSVNNVQYKGKNYNIRNEMYPFLIDDIKKDIVSLSTLRTSLAGARKDRFVADYLNHSKISIKAQKVLSEARELYRVFYESSMSLPLPKYSISNWDCGFYQIRMSLHDRGLGENEFNKLVCAEMELGDTILPRIYRYGFVIKNDHLFAEDDSI